MIDDDPNAAALVRAAVQTEPCRVEAAGSCREGRRRLAGELPTVVVIDVDLPDGSGWDLIGELRGREGGSTLPVVVSTASTRPGAPEARGLRIRWMRKPFHLRQARLLLTPLLRAARATPEHYPAP